MSFRFRLHSAYLSKIKINKIIQILTYSDSFIWGSYHMVNTLAAVYLKERIALNPIQTIANGVAVYLIARSLFQIPIAQFLDKHKSYIDEAIAIFISGLMAGVAFYLYNFIQNAWHLFAVQALFGFAVAINLPAWRKTFARFVDRGHEGAEYSIYDIIYTLFTALLITIGGYLVNLTGNFHAFFTLAAVLSVIGGSVTLLLLKYHKITS